MPHSPPCAASRDLPCVSPCVARSGRTGLIACCLLGRLYDELDAEEALERVGRYYQLRASFGAAASRAQDGMSPETLPQREQVREYFALRSEWRGR